MGALPGIERHGGVPSTDPPGPDPWDVWTAKEMGHRVVGGAAIRAGGVIGPAYGVTVGLEPVAVAGTELGEGAAVWPW